MCKIRIRPSYEIYNDLTSEDYIQLYKKWLLENSSDCSEKTARMVAEEAHKINASEQILVLISYECNIDTTEANKNVIRLRKFIKWKNWKSLLRKRGIAHRLQDLYDPKINLRATYEIFSYLYKNDYRLNPEHPPLIKDLAAFPLMFLNLNFPENHPSWTTGVNNQWWFGIL